MLLLSAANVVAVGCSSDTRYAHVLRKTYGKDCILVVGNLSAGGKKRHERICGVGWRHTFQKHGFRVLLTDEHNSSKRCPVCWSDMVTFKPVPDPRPFQIKKNPMVCCHGLLKYVDLNCLQLTKGDEYAGIPRLWNRDCAAVNNMADQINHLLRLGVVPKRFRSGQDPKPSPKDLAKQLVLCILPPPEVNTCKRKRDDTDDQ